MKKIMFNDKFDLTQAVLEGRKMMTRRMISKKLIQKYGHNKFNDKSYEFVKESTYKIGEIVAIAQPYKNIIARVSSRWNPHSHDWMREEKGWRNKMFVKAKYMPNHIRITNIKVERLQEITGEDITKEGIWLNEKIDRFMVGNKGFFLAKEAFQYLINKVSGKGTWDRNPYVFVYTFELLKGGNQ